MTPVLQAADISKSYAGIHALRAVSFELLQGEVHALIGENGAGKSTLIKVVTGAVSPDSGSLTIAGQTVSHNTPAVARSLGVAAVYQQPSLFPDLTVAENIALSLESGGLWRKVDWRARETRARDLLARTGGAIRPDRLVATLSMPEQQIVEIAKAIGASARILILDEPTASLTEHEVEALFRVIKTLRARGRRHHLYFAPAGGDRDGRRPRDRPARRPVDRDAPHERGESRRADPADGRARSLGDFPQARGPDRRGGAGGRRSRGAGR